MVINAFLGFPEVSAKCLWTMALNYATYLHNITPRQDAGMSPDEIWSVAISNHEKLRVSQTLGFTACVLDPKLQNNQKIPKWLPRYSRG